MDVWSMIQECNLVGKEPLKAKLASYLNNLVRNDFAALVQLLYRVDVPEATVKTTLRQNPGVNAGELLANLLLTRMEEKKKTLQTFRTPPPESDEERW
jgi:hypothetical protein